MSEHQIQAQFVRMVNQIPDRCLLTSFAIPNAGKRSFAVAAMLKAEGFRKGMPDWCLPVPRGPYNALWIEFKKPGEKARPEQIGLHDLLKAEGGSVWVCTSADAALEVLLTYLRRERPVTDKPTL